MYFIHVHNIGQIIGSMADLKSFFLKLFRNCHCGEISMLVTLWVLETFLFPMSNTSWVPSFRHFGLTGLKWHAVESDNFEACSVRPPVLWSGPQCRDPFFKRFDYNNNCMKVRIHFTKGCLSVMYYNTLRTQHTFPIHAVSLFPSAGHTKG